MLDRYLSWARVEKGLSKATLAAYRGELDTLADAAFGPLEELQTEDLRSYIYDRGGAPATVARRIAALRSFFAFLVRIGARKDNPTDLLDRPKVRRGLPKPVADVESAFRALTKDMRLVAVFLVETGCRISEACSIDVEPPVPDAIMVNGKGDKDRWIPLSLPAQEALTRLGGRIAAPGRTKRTIQRAFQLAGFTPHRLRHTLATELADADVDLSVIQDLLGHSSPATTRIYLKNSPERLRRGLARRRPEAA